MSSGTGENEQLGKVRENLDTRLHQGLSTVLTSLGTAEHKEALAENALSMLRHILNGSIHVPKYAGSSPPLKVLASSPKQTEQACMEFNESASAITTDFADTADIIHSVSIEQYLDESQVFLIIDIKGTVAKHTWKQQEGTRNSLRVRLDVVVQSKTPLSWELGYVCAHEPDQEIHICSRTPWQGILACTATQEGTLRVDLQAVLDSEQCQYLGTVSILSPAALMHKSLRTKQYLRKHHLPSEVETVIISGLQDSKVLENEARDVTVDVAISTSHAKVVIRTSSIISMASYISLLRLSVADPVHLRLMMVSSRYTTAFDAWMSALKSEIDAFRNSAASKCFGGLNRSSVLQLINLQIALDEISGSVTETVAS